MRAIIRDIPLGRRRTEIGLVLRQAWFLIGCFLNSEVWSGYSDRDLKDLKVIDHNILRLITGAQAKVPSQMLYLETAQLPIINVITVRRLLYLHTILTRHDTELIKQIYSAMKDDPIKGDWIHIVQKDMMDIDLNMSDDSISKLTKEDFKKIIKEKVRKSAFIELEKVKQDHIKVKHIVHDNLNNPQNYLKSSLFTNKQSSLLFNLRSHCVNEFKRNFYNSDCPLCGKSEDTQEHALECEDLIKHMSWEHNQGLQSVKYSDIYCEPEKQLRVTQVFSNIIQTREKLRIQNLPTTAS